MRSGSFHWMKKTTKLRHVSSLNSFWIHFLSTFPSVRKGIPATRAWHTSCCSCGLGHTGAAEVLHVRIKLPEKWDMIWMIFVFIPRSSMYGLFTQIRWKIAPLFTRGNGLVNIPYGPTEFFGWDGILRYLTWISGCRFCVKKGVNRDEHNFPKTQSIARFFFSLEVSVDHKIRRHPNVAKHGLVVESHQSLDLFSFP